MIRTWSMKNVVNPPGQIRDVCHHICDECETVAHCSKNGCIPKIAPEAYRQLKDAALLESDTSCFRNKGMKLRKEQ